MSGQRSGGVWSLEGLPDLHAATQGDPSLRIAVLDGPVELGHPCFEGAALEKVATVASGAHSTGQGASDHGTHVSSVIFGQPGSPVWGIAPRCSGLILDLYRQSPGGTLSPCRQRDLARAIVQAAGKGAQLINVSGGELTRSGRIDPDLERAVQQCAEANVLLVAAAGNQGCDCAQVPAALNSVLAVGALDNASQPLLFSNWGQSLRQHGIMAPGQDILGAVSGGATNLKTGTSFAAPVVTAVAALLLSLQKAAGQAPDPLAVARALLESAAPCDPQQDSDCRRLLAGRINICAARKRLGLDGNPGAEVWTSAAAGTLSADAGESSQAPFLPVGVESHLPLRPPSSGSGHFADSAPHPINTEPDKEKRMSESERSQANVQAQGVESSAPEPAEVSAAEASDGIEPSCSCNSATQPSEQTGLKPDSAEPRQGGGPELPSSAPVNTASYPLRLSPAFQSRQSQAWPSAASYSQPPRGQVLPSECEVPGDYVFVLGELGYDFGCEARLDYFVQKLGSISDAFNPIKMSEYLKPNDNPEDTNEEDANALIWTLHLDGTPVYAVEPNNQFALLSYYLLVRFLYQQYEHPGTGKAKKGEGNAKNPKVTGQHPPIDEESRLYRVAIAGHLEGAKILYNGTAVPVIRPVARGMFNWDIDRLVKAVGSDSPELRNFLKRVYYELRNLGQSPQDRALNYAGTNAFNAGKIFGAAFESGTRLDKIEVKRSPVCRPDSDCWDVNLVFFNPKELITQARTVYSYTVDVSDVVPVTVGEVREYQVYLDPRV